MSDEYVCVVAKLAKSRQRRGNGYPSIFILAGLSVKSPQVDGLQIRRARPPILQSFARTNRLNISASVPHQRAIRIAYTSAPDAGKDAVYQVDRT